jgi:type IV pilus assembly protein PilM
MSLFSQNVLGVDIGHASVKVVGLELGAKPTFLGCKEITMDPKYLQKEGFDNPVLVGQALREAMRTAAPKPIVASQAYSTVSESLVFRKVLEMPFMANPADLAAAIRLEAGQYLPDSIDTVELDYQLLGTLPDGSMQQVMMVAVPRKVIQEHLAVFQAAKMNIRGIGIKPEALGSALVKPDEKEAIMIVDIGSEVSSISVYQDRVIRVTGTVNMGGNILKDSDTGQLDQEKWDEHLKRLIGNMLDEIEHVQKFYTNRSVGTGAIKEMRLSGGGSMAAGLLDVMGREVEGMKVVLGQPVIAIPPFCDRRFMGALGSAMSPLFERL